MSEDAAKVLRLPFRPLSNKLDLQAMHKCNAVVAESFLEVIKDVEEAGGDPLPMIKDFCKQLVDRAK